MAIRITTRRRTVSEDNLIEKDGIMISTPQVEGFDEVYKRNYTRLSQYAFHIIHDKGDAEILATEAFLVYNQIPTELVASINNPQATGPKANSYCVLLLEKKKKKKIKDIRKNEISRQTSE